MWNLREKVRQRTLYLYADVLMKLSWICILLSMKCCLAFFLLLLLKTKKLNMEMFFNKYWKVPLVILVRFHSNECVLLFSVILVKNIHITSRTSLKFKLNAIKAGRQEISFQEKLCKLEMKRNVDTNNHGNCELMVFWMYMLCWCNLSKLSVLSLWFRSLHTHTPAILPTHVWSVHCLGWTMW